MRCAHLALSLTKARGQAAITAKKVWTTWRRFFTCWRSHFSGLGSLCLFFLFTRFRSRKCDATKRLGLLRLEQSTVFERKPSLNVRRLAMTQRRGRAQPAQATRKLAVLRFTGDVRASGRGSFALLVNEVIANKDKFAGVVVVVNSPGGGVAEYGQMFAEMLRPAPCGA